ncbi:hypothetical protein F4813DRAFT_390583 [Daldinia decipiens]|uniref:uncharacterized protein n=1 Tax=Daldinia decipiens TaxID=326647 RepID=UPI0020C41241|nr:uncharacterized protein F4813DRAFT_390583 [Daldinia decipiens]KAI1656542.1 hypothetical protein F4813DRAFT_390583 [Daldinia decipiens]
MDLHRRANFNQFSVSGRGNHRDKYKGNDPNPADIGLQNPKACIAACFKQFVDGLYEDPRKNLEDVCNRLSNVRPNTELWKLYCCDSTFCGVWTGKKGQSPNVDLIINKCQNIGNYLIYDPGPPPPNKFNCNSAATKLGEPGLRTILPGNDLPSIIATISSSSSIAAETSLSSKLNSTTSSIGTVPSISTGLTEGSKAAIGICSSLAIIAIVFLGGFLVSRHRQRSQSFLDDTPIAPRLGRSSSEPQSGSHTPLITPPPSASSKGPPLTPPARLSDRRFLPSLLKQGDTPNSSSVFSVDERAIVPTTLKTSTEKKTTLSRKGHMTLNDVSEPPVSLSPPAAIHFAPHFLRDSNSSYSSGPIGTSIPIGPNKGGSVHSGIANPPVFKSHSPPLPFSPTRPLRPHDEPIEIPHLVTPAGPPPSRALPAPPPYYPTSPTFTVSPISSPGSPMLPSLKSPSSVRDKSYVSDNIQREENKKQPDASTIGPTSPISSQGVDKLTHPCVYDTPESRGSREGKKGGHGGNGKLRDGNFGRCKMEENGSTVSLQELSPGKLGSKS